MDIHVLDSSFKSVKVIDNYMSCIWTERYDKFGDFELVLPLNKYESALKKASYLKIPESDEVMVIESFSETNSLKIAGRSLSSILDRRRIWRIPTAITLNRMVIDLVYVNLGEGADDDRRLYNLNIPLRTPSGFVDPSNFGEIKFGDSLYDIIASMCASVNLGFTIINPSNTSYMEFQTRFGLDRTEDLSNVVIFSKTIGNIEGLTTLESKETMRNVAILNMPAENNESGPGSIWQIAPYAIDASPISPKGIDRREVWLDLSSYKDNPEFNNPTTQPAILEAIARQELLKTPLINSVDFKLTNANKYRYGKHYNLGDIVQVTKPSGAGAKYRVTEYIRHADQQGSSEYPTLTAV